MLDINRDMSTVFNSLREGILVIDVDGRIVFGNTAYLEFLEKEAGSPLGSVVGRYLRDLRPGARLQDAMQAGKPIMHLTRKEIKDIYLTNLYPIFRDGTLVGGISVTTFLEDAYQARDELEALEKRTRQVLRSINKVNGAKYTFDAIVAESPGVRAVKKRAQQAAPTDAPVLLAAESGTGKELYAQAIHNASERRREVFVAINCANFNASILESELFGYAEGAFTGAKKGGKMGLFEAANGGTLFLDEVSEMDMSLQAKLLRAIQEKKIRPVGAVDEIDVDVRLICASNADLKTCIEEKRFRQDLFYRLSTFLIHIPPLRERADDIPALSEAILNELARKLRHSVRLDEEALQALVSHTWPGKVRELRNVLEFSAYVSADGLITRSNLPEHLVHPREGEINMTLRDRVRVFERDEILRYLQKNGSDLEGKKKTARELGISLATLYNKIEL